MSKKWHSYELTQQQIDQTKRVETALCNELNLLSREGVPVPVILAGLGMTIADLITTQSGAEAVAPWFAKQAEMIASLVGKKH